MTISPGQSSALVLRAPATGDEAAVRAAHAELLADGFDFALGLDDASADYASWLRRIADTARGVDLAPGRVPATFLLAEVSGQIVGRTSIRHTLNDVLLQIGGHIGYVVRPEYRRRGYATAILAQSLDIAVDLGIDRVLVTCDDDNVASARTIEANGGVLEDVRVLVEGTVGKRRYWIDLD